MIEQKIRKILTDETIPEPDEAAKEKAIDASLAEFRRQQEKIQKKIKGSEKSNRLMGTLTKLLTFIGDSTMKRRYVIPSALTACLIVMVFGVTQLMESQKDAFQPVVDDQLALVEGPTPAPVRSSKPKPMQEETFLVEESIELEDAIRPEPMVAEMKKERAMAPSKTMEKVRKPKVKRKAVGMMAKGDMSSQFGAGATVPGEVIAPNGRFGVHRFHAADETFGGVHGDGADHVVAQMLSDFADQVRCVRVVRIFDIQSRQNVGKIPFGKFDVDNGADYLNDFTSISHFS